MSEGETLDQLGGMHHNQVPHAWYRTLVFVCGCSAVIHSVDETTCFHVMLIYDTYNQQRNQQAQKGNARTDRNSHEHSREHSRDHSREQSRERDQSREDHRVTNRPTGNVLCVILRSSFHMHRVCWKSETNPSCYVYSGGFAHCICNHCCSTKFISCSLMYLWKHTFIVYTGGYGGGDSTTSRLHKHITKDTPPRANTHANNNNTTSNRRNDNAHTNAHHCTQYYSGDDSLVGENPFKNADTGDADQFNSNSSLYAHRGSPSPTRARAELNGDNSGDDNGPSAGTNMRFIYTCTCAGF